jgi:hypothetical protein
MKAKSTIRITKFTIPILLIFTTACSPTVVVVQPTSMFPSPIAQPIIVSASTIESTAIPTSQPTALLPATQTGCNYKATFVTDVTIPDNSLLQAGSGFIKTWRIRNDGICAWGANGHTLNKLIFSGGDQLGAASSIALPADVQPGGTIDLSVSMVAPIAPGTYTSKWLLAGDNGFTLGFGQNKGDPLSAIIVVNIVSSPSPFSDGSGSGQLLTLSALQNAQYHSPDWGDFQLVNGMYYRTPPTPFDSPQAYCTQLDERVAFGDLNADGREDAVVFLITQNGGTGHFVELAAVLNQVGGTNNISTVYLGDRVGVESAQIVDGVIILDMLVQGPNDPLMSGSQPEIWRFHLENGQLVPLP